MPPTNQAGDIVERLRRAPVIADMKLRSEAADEIERLRDEETRLRLALLHVVRESEGHGDSPDYDMTLDDICETATGALDAD